MYSAVTILDWWVDTKDTMKYTQGTQKEAITVAARLTMPPIE